MKKLALFFFFYFLLLGITQAQEGCCSYHSGVCGFYCCDGTAIPVSEPSCLSAPRDYYTQKIQECDDAQESWEDAAEKYQRDYSAIAASSNGLFVTNQSLVLYYKQKAEDAKNKANEIEDYCVLLREEYESGQAVFNADPQIFCGAYSHEVNDNYCVCDEGFEWKSSDETNLDCVKTCPANSSRFDEESCICDKDYEWQINIDGEPYCALRQKCNDEENGYYDEKTDTCYCNDGFIWNDESLKCVEKEIECGQNASLINDQCYCNDGYQVSSNNIDCVEIIDETSNFEEEAQDQEEQSFSDVAENHKNQKAIEYMKEKGIINGYSDGTFKPENYVNRAELLKLIIEAKLDDFDKEKYDDNCFSDVIKAEWYAPYVCYAKEQKWVNGYSDDTFKPNQTVSKAEAVKIILVAYGFDISEEIESSSFDDVGLTDWYAPYLERANNSGFLEIKSGKYNPNQGMTRANVSQVIYNVLMFLE